MVNETKTDENKASQSSPGTEQKVQSPVSPLSRVMELLNAVRRSLNRMGRSVSSDREYAQTADHLKGVHRKKQVMLYGAGVLGKFVLLAKKGAESKQKGHSLVKVNEPNQSFSNFLEKEVDLLQIYLPDAVRNVCEEKDFLNIYVVQDAIFEFGKSEFGNKPGNIIECNLNASGHGYLVVNWSFRNGKLVNYEEKNINDSGVSAMQKVREMVVKVWSEEETQPPTVVVTGIHNFTDDMLCYFLDTINVSENIAKQYASEITSRGSKNVSVDVTTSDGEIRFYDYYALPKPPRKISVKEVVKRPVPILPVVIPLLGVVGFVLAVKMGEFVYWERMDEYKSQLSRVGNVQGGVMPIELVRKRKGYLLSRQQVVSKAERLRQLLSGTSFIAQKYMANQPRILSVSYDHNGKIKSPGINGEFGFIVEIRFVVDDPNENLWIAQQMSHDLSSIMSASITAPDNARVLDGNENVYSVRLVGNFG